MIESQLTLTDEIYCLVREARRIVGPPLSVASKHLGQTDEMIEDVVIIGHALTRNPGGNALIG